MKAEIKIPAMGESISEATIGTLLKANGSQVNVDDELLELETDKVNQVLYAQQAGTLSWATNQGDRVKIGQVIGSIETSKEASQPTQKEPQKENEPPKETSTKDTPKKEEPKSSTKPAAKPEKEQATSKEAFSISQPTLNSPASSTAARSTKDQFLNELKEEPRAKSEKTQKISDKTLIPESTEKSETRKKMSKVRKVIATRLVEVMQQTAMLTTFNEVDMTKIISLREAYKETFAKQYNVRLGFMSFFVKAAVSAMEMYPEINAYIDGDDIVYRQYYDIGIAVGTDKGLFVPVIRNCNYMSFADIEHTIESYATKAREGGLVPGDLQGGGFTITNGGTYGSLLSTPILNPPQSAILGMHKIMKRPVVVDDQIVIRQMMYLALSYDHRIVDGKEAVSFLVHIKNILEDPSRLLIGV